MKTQKWYVTKDTAGNHEITTDSDVDWIAAYASKEYAEEAVAAWTPAKAEMTPVEIKEKYNWIQADHY